MPRDLEQAQSYLDRAKVINAKVDAERQRIISALSQAATVMILLTVFGLLALSQADRQFKIQALKNQELTWKR